MSKWIERSPLQAISTTLLAAITLASCDTASTQSNAAMSCGIIDEHLGTFVELSSGSFIKGAAPVYPEERPSLQVNVDTFWIQYGSSLLTIFTPKTKKV